jgi:serine/threonine-protein kinase
MSEPISSLKNPQFRSQLEEIRLVATGGMAHIFKAWQPSLQRHVAIKKLKDELLSQEELVERFRREAKALSSMLHQNIAHVYDFVETASESFLIMEFIDGVDLSTVIEKLGGIPPRIASCILLGVARGLFYIHAHGLIHRDVKPSNIRLTTRGEVKLMDFGIVFEVENTSLTKPGLMVGSPHYLSPEQVLGDKISHQSDIFLLGICFYEMLTGMRPFQSENGRTVFQKIREVDYVPVRKMNRKIPKALARVVDKCLQQDPDRRYASLTELSTDLENYLGAEAVKRPEKIILDFLDREALVNAAITVEEEEERADSGMWKSFFRGVFIVLAYLCVFGIGYSLGKRNFEGVSFPVKVLKR